MKFTKYLFSIMAAAGLLASCAQLEEKVQISSEVIPPVLHELDGDIVITQENLGLEKVVFEWDAADYGVATQIDYSLEVSVAAKDSARYTISTGLTDTTMIEVSYEDLNAILLYEFELEEGVATKLNFYVSSKVGTLDDVYSEPLAVNVTAASAEKIYPKMWVVGSYCNWDHGTSTFLFDFAGQDDVYQGVVDFGESREGNEFKFTGGDWGNNEYSATGEQAAEAATITLVAGGGDNIKAYTEKRYYHFSMSKAGLQLTKNASFDQIGIVGDFNEWGTDVVMTFDKATQVFWADVEIAADGTLKFRADNDWVLNWGVDGKQGGDNIPVTVGNYRVYLNLNDYGNVTYQFNAKDYGK